MKNIKFLLTALIAIVLTTTSAKFAQAGHVVTTPVVAPANNPERIADAMLFGSEAVAYRGDFQFSRDLGDGSPQSWVRGSFVMNLRGGITELTIDGEQVLIAPGKPLKGLPANTHSKAIDFNAWISGVDSRGEYVSYASFYTRLWKAGDPVNFELIPAGVRTTLSFAPPAGVNQNNLKLRLSNGNSFGYNSYSEGFSVWLDPLLRDQDYSVVDTSTGQVLQVGTIDPFRASVVNKDSPVNIRLAEGVLNIPISETNRSAWFDGVALTTTVQRGADFYPARVLYADLKGGGLAMEIYNPAQGNIFVEVYEVTPEGETSVGGKYANSSPLQLAIPKYLGKVRIVIIGDSQGAVSPGGVTMFLNWFNPSDGWNFNPRG